MPRRLRIASTHRAGSSSAAPSLRWEELLCLLALSILGAFAIVTTFPDHGWTCMPFHTIQCSTRNLAAVNIDRVIVNTAIVQHKIAPNFLGLNYTAFWEPAEGSIASARALAHLSISRIRFPGGAPADWYDWQEPYYKSSLGYSRTSPLQLWRWARLFGARLVVFQTNFQGHIPNPPNRAYTVNSPDNAAAWVAYNRSHKIHADMEVGNEEDQHMLRRPNDSAFNPYVAGFNRQARAMHRADPHVRVLGPAGTNAWYWWHLHGLETFLRGTGNRTGSGQVDGITLHYYDGSNWSDSSRAAQYWMSPHGPWGTVQKVIRANDSRKLPVYITEWNLGNKDFHNDFTPTVGHALAVVDMIGAFATSGVAAADYFTIHRSDGWGLLYGTNDTRPVDTPTPTYYAMAMWSHMGSRVVYLHQTDDAASAVSTYATTRKDGSVQLLVINKRPSSSTLQVRLHGTPLAGRHLSVFTLRGSKGGIADLDARYNGSIMPSPQRQLPEPKHVGVLHSTLLSYKVQGYSAVILYLDASTYASPQSFPHRLVSLPPRTSLRRSNVRQTP